MVALPLNLRTRMAPTYITDNIRDPLLRGIHTAYRLFWPNGECICNSATGTWPNLVGPDGLPVVCLVHEWEAKRRQLQARVESSGLSMPVSRDALEKVPGSLETNVIQYYEDVNLRPASVSKAPFLIHEHQKNPRNGRLSSQLANFMASRGHVVYLIHKSQAISLIYGQREEDVEQALLWAPVLVYWDCPDRRANGTERRIEALIGMRQHGYTFLLGG